jgi:hypothetical protein
VSRWTVASCRRLPQTQLEKIGDDSRPSETWPLDDRFVARIRLVTCSIANPVAMAKFSQPLKVLVKRGI